MPDLNKPIEVSSATGAIDTAAAAFRLLLVVAGTVPLMMKLLGERDFIGLIAYLQSAEGVAWIGAVTTLASIAYGLLKTLRRGRQVATIAGDPRVPDSVASLK